MSQARRCAVCGRAYQPEPRSWRHQKYCSKECARKAKRQRDRKHKRSYRETGLGREQRRRESEQRCRRIGWAEYMRYWRKSDAARATQLNRAALRRYYARHRDEILRKRRQQQAAQKALAEARSK